MATQGQNYTIRPIIEWIYEAKYLSKIALPMIMSHVFIILIEVTDSIMASSLGPLNLAAIAVSNSILYPIILALIGLTMVLSPVVAKYRGRKDFHSLNKAMTSMIAIAIAVGLLMTGLMTLIIKLMPTMGIDATVIPYVSAYMEARFLGIVPFAIYLVFRFYFEGRAKTSTVMKATAIAFVCNIPLNWVLMTGWGIFPAMGIKGIGLSTSIIEILLCLLMMWKWHQYFFEKYFRYDKTIAPTQKMITKLLRLGIPSGLAYAAEVGMFAIMGIALSRISAISVAAHQVALSVSAVTFIIPLGIAGGLASRIGYLTGKSNSTVALKRAIKLGIGAIVLVMGLSSIILWTQAVSIASLYSSDAMIIASATQLIMVVALYQLFDGTQVAFNGILKGFHDTQIPMWMVLFSYWVIGFGSGMALSKHTSIPELGVWYGIALGLVVSATLLGARVLKKMNDFSKTGH